MYRKICNCFDGCYFLIAIQILLLIVLVDLNHADESMQESPLNGIEIFSNFLENDLPKLLLGNPYLNENYDEFKEYAMNDQSNEEIGTHTIQAIIARSGFKYKNYQVVSPDGYITRLIRIINPQADRKKLKQPPVMLLHGGTIDYTSYVWASSIQHHPEKYPRTDDNWPTTSWNRSLGFMLANNGYDCWLVGTRGSDIQNQGHVKLIGPKSIERDDDRPSSSNKNLLTRWQDASEYWRFSMEDIVHQELPAQIDQVLRLTGASKVNLLSYSMSTMTTLTLLGERPDYHAKVHSLVSIAPIVNAIGCSNLTLTILKATCALPDDVGATIYSQLLLTGAIRKAMLSLSKNRNVRYNYIKPLSDVAFGNSSSRYLTLLEPAVVGHLFMPIAFKLMKHYFQQVIAGRLQKFDHGPIDNFLLYDSIQPPKVNISNLGIEHWLLMSGTHDNLSRPSSIKQLLAEVNYPKPYKNIVLEGYNHLDLMAAFNNDKLVNLPILEFYDQCQLKPLFEETCVKVCCESLAIH